MKGPVMIATFIRMLTFLLEAVYEPVKSRRIWDRSRAVRRAFTVRS